MASTLEETKKYYNLYNTLDERRTYLTKEISLINSIHDNFGKVRDRAPPHVATRPLHVRRHPSAPELAPAPAPTPALARRPWLHRHAAHRMFPSSHPSPLSPSQPPFQPSWPLPAPMSPCRRPSPGARRRPRQARGLD